MRRTDLTPPPGASLNSMHQHELELGRVPPTAAIHGGSGRFQDDCLLKPYFDPQTVVSLDPNGKPQSSYGDINWNLSSMGTDGGQSSCNLYFFEAQPLSFPSDNSRPNLAALVREQQKALLWLHMDAGRQRSLRTMVQTNLALTQLARSAYRRGVTLFELFCDPGMLGDETAEMNSTYSKGARALLRTLWRHRDFLKVGVEVHLKQLGEAIKQSTARGDADGNQTPLIPSRVYCAILGQLLGKLDEIELDLDTLLAAYRQDRLTTNRAPVGLTRRQHQVRRDRLLQKIHDAMRARGWTEGSLRAFIAGEISRIQLSLLNLVVAFTGMRREEAQILPLKGALDKAEHRGAVHHVVCGYSHKLNGGKKKPASWVTSHEGHRAITLAMRIAATILEVCGTGNTGKVDAALLFCSTNNPYKKIDSSTLYRLMVEDLIPEVCPLITQADIDELNALELERGWLREGIAVGEPWPLTFHQYRRSLSVYAHRSGMVSLPALKRQLQHITDELRAYYSDGFCRAVNLVFDRDHFSHEWNAARAESSYLGYALGILFSDEEFLGLGAERMANTVANHTRSETLQLFKDGKIAYKETVLGGCVSTEACKALPLEVLQLECLEKDCANLAVSPKRLTHVIRSQQTVVATLERDECGSVQHRIEMDSLQVLLKWRSRLPETT